MKIALAAAFVVIFLGLAFLLSVAGAQDPAVSRISVTAQLVDSREHYRMRTDVSLLWKRSIRQTPIGHGVLDCHTAGKGGILGGGLSFCHGIYVLPQGKIVAMGLVHSFERYTLVITGGSGIYEDADGSLTATRVASGLRLVFTYR